MPASNHDSDATDDPVWGLGRCTATLRLNFLSEPLNMEEVSLFADDKIVYASEAGEWHNYFQTGVNFMFNKYAGFVLDKLLPSAS